MNKKLLFLCFLLCAAQTKPFFFSVFVKRYSVSFVQRFKEIWQTRMHGSMSAQATASLEKLQTQALVSKEKMAASLVAFKARVQAIQIKNPFVDSVWYSKIHKTTAKQGQQASNGAAQSGQAGPTFVQNNTQYVHQTLNRWSIFSGTADAQLARELAEQQGKTKFWKGACLGSIGTALLLKKFDRKAEEEKK